MRIDQQVVSQLSRYFVRRDKDTTFGGNINPDETDTHSIGTSTRRVNTIYARSVIADNIGGAEGGGGVSNADMVDGFHASQTPTANTILPLDANGYLQLVRLGIGVSPTVPLHVYGAGKVATFGTTDHEDQYILVRDSIYGAMFGYEDALDGTLIQSGTGKTISFNVDNSTFGSGTTALRILSDGNVGIGTTTPQGKLHVKGTADDQQLIVQANGTQTANILEVQDSASNADIFVIDGSENVGIGTASPLEKLHISGLGTGIRLFSNYQAEAENDTELNKIHFYKHVTGGPNETIKIYNIATFAEHGYGQSDLRFSFNNGAAMIDRVTFKSSGNVGIGTTSPGALLDVSEGDLALLMGADSGANTRTNATTKWARMGGYHYTNAEEPVALFNMQSEITYNIMHIGGGHSSLNAATYLLFYTAVDGTTLTGTERMRIDYLGNVGIGTSPAGKLHVKGTADDQQLIIQANSTQTAKITEWQKSTGAMFASVVLHGSSGSGLFAAINNDPHDPTTGVSVGANFAFNLSDTNFFGMGLGSVRDSNYDIWFQTGDINGGGYRFYFNGTNEKVTFDNDGNIGIGTTTPKAKQHTIISTSLGSGILYSTSDWATASAGSGLSIVSTAATGNTSIKLQVYDQGASSYNDLILQPSGSNVGIGTASPAGRLHVKGTADDQQLIVQANATQTADILQVRDSANNSDIFVIDGSENVGIGTTSPDEKLDVRGDTQVVNSKTHVSGDVVPNDAILRVYNDWESNTLGKGAIIIFEDNYYDGIYHRTTRAAIKGGTDTIGNTADGYLAFYTDQSGANTATERVRIDHFGRVGIGTTSLTEKLTLAGNLQFTGTATIATGAGNLTIAPTADLHIDAGGQEVIFDNWNAGDSIESDTYASQTTGWAISYGSSGGHADFRSMYADELHVKAFVAEIYSALAGALIITKSRGRLSRDFIIPLGRDIVDIDGDVSGAAIVIANIASDYFDIVGNETSNIAVGDKFTVAGSTSNDGVWTVQSTSWQDPHTRIYVTGDVTDNTADGTITFHHYFTIAGDQTSKILVDSWMMVSGSSGNDRTCQVGSRSYDAVDGETDIYPKAQTINSFVGDGAIGGIQYFYVEDLEGWENVQIFEYLDYVRLRYIDMAGGGLIVTDVWGIVTNYADQAGGEQRYHFWGVDDGGVFNGNIYTGAVALDYGYPTSGSHGVWEATVLDQAGAPYSQVKTWDDNPWEAGNWTVNVRLGNLDGISGVGLEYGLWAGDGATNTDAYLLLSDNSAEIHNIPLEMHDSSTAVITLTPSNPASDPSLMIGVNSNAITYSSGIGIWMGRESATYKFRVGNPAGVSLDWDGADFIIGDTSNEHILIDSTQIEINDGAITYLKLSLGQITLGEFSSGEYTKITSDGIRMYSEAHAHVYLDAAGELTLGYTTDGEYVTVASTGMKFYSGGDVTLEFDSSGNATFGQVATDQGNMYWNNAVGKKILEFRGGTDGTEVQAYVHTDGSIMAGGGAVKINSYGISLDVGNAYGLEGSYAFRRDDTDALVGSLWGIYKTSPQNYHLYLSTWTNDGYDSYITIVSESSDATDDAQLALEAQRNTVNIAGFYVGSNSVDGEWAKVSADDFEINANASIGGNLIIDQGTDDDRIFSVASDDVTHGMTDFAPTNTYGLMKKVEATSGGLQITGFKDANGVAGRALDLVGKLGEAADTTKSTSGIGVIHNIAQIRNGTGSGITDVGTNGNLFAVANNGTTRWIVDAEGDTYRDGSDNSFPDAYDDVELVRAFALETGNDTVIRSEFDKWIKYNRDDLIRAGILSEDGFYNESALMRLHTGAVWQLAQKIRELEMTIDALQRR